jgi:hypothetical protein
LPHTAGAVFAMTKKKYNAYHAQRTINSPFLIEQSELDDDILIKFQIGSAKNQEE